MLCKSTEFLHLALNTDSAPRCLIIESDPNSLNKVGFASAGLALKLTTSLDAIYICLCDEESVPAHDVKDLLKFLSDNSSLKSVTIYVQNGLASKRNSRSIGNLLAAAATSNPRLENISLRQSSNLNPNLIPVFEGILVPKHAKLVHLEGTFNLLSFFWQQGTTIQTLVLDVDGTHPIPLGFWGTLTRQSVVIKHLSVLCEYPPSLNHYLLSPKSNVQTLEFNFMYFGDQKMEYLSDVLSDCQTLTSLIFVDCRIEENSMASLQQALGTGRSGVALLDFAHTGEIPGAFHRSFRALDYRNFLECRSLKVLGFRGINLCADEHLETIKHSLRTSSLAVYKLTTRNFSGWAPSLKLLTGLVLAYCNFNEASLHCLVELLQDANCKLKVLDLQDWCGEAKDIVPARVFCALNGTQSLRTLGLAHNSWAPIFDGMLENLAQSKALTTLRLSAHRDYRLSSVGENDISSAIRKNWSLESVLLPGEVPLSTKIPKPSSSVGLKRKVQNLLRRNKAKSGLIVSCAKTISLRPGGAK